MIDQPVSPRWGLMATVFAVALLAAIPLTASAEAEREGDKPRGEAREGEGRAKTGARDGEQPKTGARDGDKPRGEAREGEGRAKTGARDGDKPREGARDGEKPRGGAREGEGSRRMSAEGEGRGKASAEGGRSAAVRRGEATDNTPPITTMVIRVNAAGEVTNSKGEAIPMNQVRGRMAELARATPNQPIIIRSEASSPADQVNALRDALRDVGWKNITLETATP